MKNKVILKRYFHYFLIISIFLCISFLFLNIYEYNTYTKNYNYKISSIISILKDKYPNISEEEIITILNNDDSSSDEILKKYSIDINKSSIIIKNDNDFYIFLIVNLLFLIISFLLFLLIFNFYNNKKEKEIKEIIKCIEEINNKNYELKIDSISEDELSILKNEIYKTTIMLKEAAENSNKDKVNLKKSLEDISHQLKTPLTSILVMLDNIIEDPNMDLDIRNDFIIDIKRNVLNINFLVQSILKLSKFDSNTIKFIKNDYSIKEIVNESIKNVSPLCDLKNTGIELNIKEDCNIICDYRWQVEALTNILKNAIDHSKDNNKVIVNVDNNSIYCSIEIINFGDIIPNSDIKHIFERFYKGKNSKDDSIGIGLALSKMIIEEDNGIISVESNDKETKFIIKYYKI